MSAVEAKLMTKTFNQTKFDRYVAREVKSMQRLRAKGHRDFTDMTDQQIAEWANASARIYGGGTEVH